MKTHLRFLAVSIAVISTAIAQTTISNPVGSAMGSSHGIFNDQYLGTRFTLTDDLSVTSFAADFTFGNDQDIFVAVVSLADPSGFPAATSTMGLSNPSEIVFSTLFNPGLLVNQLTTVTIPVSFDLSAGSYAVVFGSGAFGSSLTAAAGLQNYQSVVGSDSIAWTAPSTEWSTTQFDLIAGGVPAYSISITGNTITSSVPDSGSVGSALGIALIAGVIAHRRLRMHPSRCRPAC